MAATVRAHRLGAVYGSQQRLFDVSFEVQPNEVVGVLGANGAGKTTLFHRLLGALPGPGTARVAGCRGTNQAPSPHRVGAVLDTLTAHPGLRACYLLASWCRSLGLPRRRVDELLETVGLSTLEGRRVGQLSLGMRQRLALALALAPQPRLLVLDEPTNGLDPLGIRWINSVITDFAAQGGAVLLSSHHLSQLDHLAQRVLLIDAGRLVTDEPMHDFKMSAGPLTHRVACSRASDLQEQLMRRGAHVLRSSDDELLVTGCQVNELAHLAHDYGGIIRLLAPEGASLETSFHRHLDRYRRSAA